MLLPASCDTSKHKYVLFWGHNPSLLSRLFLWPDDWDSGWPQCPWSLWGKRQKIHKKPLKEADFAAAGESPESRSKKFTSPAPQNKRATQHWRPRRMADSGRKQGSGFSSQAPHPPSAPPCDVVASCGHHSPHVHEMLAFHRLGGQGKLMEQLVCISDFFNSLIPGSALSSFL